MGLCIGKKILATPQMIWILYRVRCLLLVFWSQGRVLAATVNKRYSKEEVSITCYSLYDRFYLQEKKRRIPFFCYLFQYILFCKAKMVM